MDRGSFVSPHTCALLDGHRNSCSTLFGFSILAILRVSAISARRPFARRERKGIVESAAELQTPFPPPLAAIVALSRGLSRDVKRRIPLWSLWARAVIYWTSVMPERGNQNTKARCMARDGRSSLLDTAAELKSRQADVLPVRKRSTSGERKLTESESDRPRNL